MTTYAATAASGALLGSFDDPIIGGGGGGGPSPPVVANIPNQTETKNTGSWRIDLKPYATWTGTPTWLVTNAGGTGASFVGADANTGWLTVPNIVNAGTATITVQITDANGSDTDTFDFITVTAGGTEYIIRLEDMPSWNSPTDYAAVGAAFGEAINDASSHASSSFSNRGVIELEPNTTYLVSCANPTGGNNNDNSTQAIFVNKNNVEIRTRTQPTRASGNQAVLKFRSWAGQTGVRMRTIMKINGNNVKIGWVDFDGNRLSCGANYTARVTYFENNINYVTSNGGIHGVRVVGGNNIYFKECSIHDTFTDGLTLSDQDAVSTMLITNFLAEDCTFNLVSRNCLGLNFFGNPNATWDQVIFRNCLMADGGDLSGVMPGERPGFGCDLEPMHGGGGASKDTAHCWGLTFDTCQFNNNHGGTWINGVNQGGPGTGRGLGLQYTASLHYMKVINCSASGNRNEGFKINAYTPTGGPAPSIDHMYVEDWTGSGSSGQSTINTSNAGKVPDTGVITNAIWTNCNVATIVFGDVAASGHDLKIYKGDYNPTITLGGKTGISVLTGKYTGALP